MTQVDTQVDTQTTGIIDIIPSEIEDFEQEVKRFQAGEWDETDFMAFRLRQGVYGQRQPDVHMIRIKFPFGGMTAAQLDQMGEIVERFAPLNRGHVTTRENIQLHHVPLEETPELLKMLAAVGLTTREACGNTVRNVTGCAMAGVCSDEAFDVTPYAAAYSRYFVRHPFTQMMPRKIKTAFSGCDRDCAITSIHDVGFLPRIQDGKRGFKMVMGGGTSIMPRIAPTLYEFISVDDYLKVTDAALRVFHASDELRRNRSKARVKFLIARIG
ncbi:MAG: nitrite/sulfite reductase, partial [Chloroflexi bacterium]|nr:nitrite/sulfite reductase [Chloroflexota bacterium]